MWWGWEEMVCPAVPQVSVKWQPVCLFLTCGSKCPLKQPIHLRRDGLTESESGVGVQDTDPPRFWLADPAAPSTPCTVFALSILWRDITVSGNTCLVQYISFWYLKDGHTASPTVERAICWCVVNRGLLPRLTCLNADAQNIQGKHYIVATALDISS